MNDFGFHIPGQPILSSMEELEHLIDELDGLPQKTRELREQEQQIFDKNIYMRSDGQFQVVEITKRAVKTVYVVLPSGVKQCLPGKYMDETGRWTRHTKTMDQEFFCGWRARQQLWEEIEATERRGIFLKRKVVPGLVREIRQAGEPVPSVLVGRLRSVYAKSVSPEAHAL